MATQVKKVTLANDRNAKFKKMTAEECFITPDMAMDFLRHNERNRKLSPTHIGSMVMDMQNGTWDRSPSGIAFDENGDLVDGQHRLKSIVQSGIGHWMLVIRNAPRGSHLDTGRHRTSYDNIRMAYPDLGWVCPRATGIGSTLRYSFKPLYKTQDELAKYLSDHENALLWTLELAKTCTANGFRKSPVLAAIMIAYENGVDTRILEGLAHIFKNADNQVQYDALVNQSLHQLRNYICARQIRFASGGHENRTLLYLVSQALYEISKGIILSDMDVMKPYPFTIIGRDGEVIYRPAAPVPGNPPKPPKPTSMKSNMLARKS